MSVGQFQTNELTSDGAPLFPRASCGVTLQ